MKGMCKCCGEIPVAPADINAEANKLGFCVHCYQAVKIDLELQGITLGDKPADKQALAGKK